MLVTLNMAEALPFEPTVTSASAGSVVKVTPAGPETLTV
jgi:hypothetical protein